MKDLIAYKNGIIYLKTGLAEVNIKEKAVIIYCDIFLLGKDKTILGIP